MHSWSLGFSEQRVFHVWHQGRKFSKLHNECLHACWGLADWLSSHNHLVTSHQLWGFPFCIVGEDCDVMVFTPTKIIRRIFHFVLDSHVLTFIFTRVEIGARSQWFTMIKSSSILRCAGSETSEGLVLCLKFWGSQSECTCPSNLTSSS